MPRPHFPPHAGPYAPAWNPDPANFRPAGSEPRSRAALEAEIERLRQELAQLQQDEDAYPLEIDTEIDNKRHARAMLCCALLLCGAALLFAVAAISYHG